ncbi:MAG: hypothetical protein A3K83_03300 [Omnitrophica WOR_2 bacterium RBG_13_44_8b]|nr:MAG: hypothetical protein A3K83_03300 [Omnitrophica WOR_2 bacterium RBG_13_44_8b]
MKKVIDAHALLTFLEREPGFEKVEAIFVNAVEKDSNVLMSAVNFGEVYYIVLRECGPKKLEEVIRAIESLPIDILDVDKELAKEAGELKAHKKMSYADCFAAALAKINRAELITGDKDFKEVEDKLKIVWIE